MLAMVVNDDAGILTPRGEAESIASVLAPTGERFIRMDAVISS
ncbi:hypothetical protein [Pseudomonas sp. NPDC089569]